MDGLDRLVPHRAVSYILPSIPTGEMVPTIYHAFLISFVFFYYSTEQYYLNRSLTQTEWDILQSYTRRIRTIHRFDDRGLNAKSFEILSNPPTTEPLFPNLQYLRCRYTQETMPLLRQPLPSLIDLKVLIPVRTSRLLLDSFKSFPMFSPDIKNIFIEGKYERMVSIEPDYLCRWQNLCAVYCPGVALDMVALEHLSRMPALTRLDFASSATLAASESPLLFSHLQDLTLHSKESLNSISWSLSQIRLPGITTFGAIIINCPSKQELSSFLTSLLTSNFGHTIETLELHQQCWGTQIVSVQTPLGFEDLRPCMSFSNLRKIALRICCSVDLTDANVLTLASAWPKLECLSINQEQGWGSQGGITPDGLARLLQTCPLLTLIVVCLDPRGYTQVTPSHAPESLRLAARSTLMIDVLDAAIEANSVLAIASFFAGIATCCDKHISLISWECTMMDVTNSDEYDGRWDTVRGRIAHLLEL